MQAEIFTSRAPGKLVPLVVKDRVRRGGKVELIETSTHAFVPDPLPPDLDWKVLRGALYEPLAEVERVLGRLDGLLTNTPNADILLRALWAREAKLSSEIEDIHTTAEEMVLAGGIRSTQGPSPALETWNYVRALEHGVNSPLPLCTRLICEMHTILLADVRGEDKRPGEFRTMPVRIGDPALTSEHARFVPPPAEHVGAAMQDLERFANAKNHDIPSIVPIILTHYQFETIHPFRDGNGRIGRVLIARSLCKEGRIKHPVVYVSKYLQEHKSQYIDLLLRVSTHGDWNAWIAFMLEAVIVQAIDAAKRTTALIQLKEHYYAILKGRKAQSRQLAFIDQLFAMPITNATLATKQLGVSDATARSDIKRLTELGILEERSGRKKDQYWAAGRILDIIELDEIDEAVP